MASSSPPSSGGHVLVDILLEDLHSVLWEDVMERLNLNVPEATRAALRRLASEAGVKEAELARELLVRAVEGEERAELLRDAAAAARAPALKARLRKISLALEKVHGAR
jgi:hypothetical protein